jgi:hypothetical protein
VTLPYKPAAFFNYFRDCYKLDYREFTIDNLFSVKYKYKWFATPVEELLNKELPIIPYNNKNLDDLEKEMALYHLEKKLYYAAFFILGRHENPIARDKRICAPLLLFPCRIDHKESDAFLRLEADEPMLNNRIINRLSLRQEEQGKEAFIEEILDNFVHNYSDAVWLHRIFAKYFDNIDSEELLFNPNTWNPTKIRQWLASNKVVTGHYKIVPAAGTVFVEKSESSLRVLSDLEALAGRNVFNHALNDLLVEDYAAASTPDSHFRSKLNPEQFKALENASRYRNSVIIGPPGTGKSFTIATLAADAAMRGESVLVVSKTRQAVEVIRHMLMDQFKLKDYLIHTSGYGYKASLMAKIRRFLSGIYSRNAATANDSKMDRIARKLAFAEKEFTTFVEHEMRLSELEFNPDRSLRENWERLYIKYGYRLNTKIWKHFQQINYYTELLRNLLQGHIRNRIARNLERYGDRYRVDLALFYDALAAGSFTEYKEILNDVEMRNILRMLPIWLVHLPDLNAVLPTKPDLFDLVIMDEATQCDIASALPAIFRARRVVIAGDPNQLRHYSFVSGKQQEKARDRYALPREKIFDYRNRSTLDLFIGKVRRQDQVTFLREHYRSTPSLIEFSNRQFYDGQLEIMKSTPEHLDNFHIKLIQVNGKRNNKGVNKAEADALMRQLQELIDKYMTMDSPPSIGIISLLSSQVGHINGLLQKQFDLKLIKQFKLLCGSPYHFQGSERDIMLISFAVCPESHHSAYVHVNKPDVFNVALTRAKSFQYIFTSVNMDELKKESLLSQYFSFIKAFASREKSQSCDDPFQREVVTFLRDKQFSVRCAYPVGGVVLDILVVRDNQNFFIDLIGHPGEFAGAFTPERYKALGRMGIRCLPLHYSYWNDNRFEAENQLLYFLEGKALVV